MKKFFYLAAAALVALWACDKKVDPVSEPDPDAITLVSEAVVNLEGESSISTVVFKTNAAWTASVDEEFLVPDVTKGEAGDEVKIKVTAQNLPDGELGRYGNLTIKAGTAEAKVLFYQGKVFIVSDDVALGVDGGVAEFSIVTNLEYTFKKYDGEDQAFPWAPVTFDEQTGKGSFNVAKNGDYDARSAYVKFTVPAIQVPHYEYDEENDVEYEDGTEDAVYRIYVYQAGNAKVVWSKGLPAGFDVENTDDHDATVSIAKFDGKYLVSDATKVYSVDPATGEMAAFAVPADLPVQSIANDDAGNLLFAPLIPYGGVGKIYAVKATDTAMENPVMLIPFVNDAWSGSRGADKIAAKGDVFGDAVVSMIYGGVASYGGLSYGLVWEIKDGAAAVVDYNEWNKTTTQALGWFTTPALADDLWLSNRAAFMPMGSSVSDGFFYSGYDGNYNLYYHDGTEWSVMIPELGNWAYAPNGMASTIWNNHYVIAVVNMAYFPEWGMPSYLVVADLTAGEVLAVTEYYNEADGYVTGGQESSTTSVILEVEGNDLCATLVDSAWGVVNKIKYPKL